MRPLFFDLNYRIVKLFIASIVLFKICLNNADLTISQFCKFYDYEKNLPAKILSTINKNFFNKSARFFGFDTGYGFFAPNVAHNFIIVHEVDGSGIGDKNIRYPMSQLRTKEGKLRFTVLHQIFMEKISKDLGVDEYDAYLTTLLLILQKYEGEQWQESVEISTTLFLYDYPTLKQAKLGNSRLKLIEVERINNRYD